MVDNLVGIILIKKDISLDINYDDITTNIYQLSLINNPYKISEFRINYKFITKDTWTTDINSEVLLIMDNANSKRNQLNYRILTSKYI